jgi:hypothetical protein
MRLYEDIHLETTDRAFILRNDRLTLRFARRTGAWEGLAYAGEPETDLIGAGALSDSVDIELDGVWLIAAHDATLDGYEVNIDPPSASASLQMRFDLPARGRLVHSVTLTAGATRVARALRWTSAAGAPDTQFTRFRLALPDIRLGCPQRVLFDAPGPFPFWDRDEGPRAFIPIATPVDRLVDHRDYPYFSAPDTGLGLVSLSRPAEAAEGFNAARPGLCIAAWMATRGETGYTPLVTRAGDAVTLAFLEERATRLAAHLTVSSGVQHLVITPALPDALHAYRDNIARTLPPLQSGPALDWVREMVLLEVMPKYFLAGTSAPGDALTHEGTAPAAFRNLASRLPLYRDIGITAIHLMPHWKGGYSPIDLFAVDPAYGTAADLRALVDTAHRLGMRFLFDLVIHGFNEASPVLSERQDLFFRDVAGNLARHPTWGSMSTDWASSAYQGYMADLARFNLREYDIDGYRVDAASFKGPNWDPALSYPAYLSGTAGADVIAAMLNAMRETKPGAVMLNEVFGPGFYTVCDLAHDNMTMGPQLFLEQLEAGEVTAATYKAHLANVREALPDGAGARRVYFARNHDTSWFYHFNGYTPRFAALDAIHAFFGIPEVFAGDPDHGPNPDTALWDFYRTIFTARRRYPELVWGEVALREVVVDNPMVFAGARRVPGQATSLVVVSLSDRHEQVLVEAPVRRWGLRGVPFWFDVLSGKALGAGAALPVSRNERDPGAGWALRLAPGEVVLGRWLAGLTS